MKISELIVKLQSIKEVEGDLNICLSEPHEYWGSVEQHLEERHIEILTAQPEGPKSGKTERAIVFTND